MEGTTLTIDDGTDRNRSVTFEFDDDGSVFGGGAPAETGSTWNQLDDLNVEGNFSHPEAIHYVVEIDSTQGSADTFRWSKDGGQTFVDERVDINGSSQPLAYDINVTFGATTGHGLGDRWALLRIQPILSYHWTGGGKHQKLPGCQYHFGRDALRAGYRLPARSWFALSIRTSTGAASDKAISITKMDRIMVIVN